MSSSHGLQTAGALHSYSEHVVKQEPLRPRSKLRGNGSRIATLWRKGHREAREDMQRNWLVFLIILFWFGGLITCMILLSLVTPLSQFGRASTACRPDGSFSILGDVGFSYWSSSGLFQITLGIGALSFTQAKAIDVCWDIVFGRGGQSVVALISGRVFVRYFARSMEHTSITFDTYRTVFLHTDFSVLTIYRMIRDFTSRLRLRSIAAMCFIVATLIYTLAFPTLGSAMTGYSANVESYVPDRDGNFIRFAAFDTTAYVINDGWRINKTDSFHVPNLKYGELPFEAFLASDDVPCQVYLPSHSTIQSAKFLSDCYLLANVTSYFKKFGSNGLAEEQSSFMGTELRPPVLNITPIYLAESRLCRFSSHCASRWDSDLSLSEKSKIIWTWSNQTFDKQYITTKGRCQSVETYQWGFSYIQLNIMIILALTWSTGMMVMHLRSRRIFKKRGGRSIAGKHKAVFELAHAMQQQLALLGSGQRDAMASSSGGGSDIFKRRLPSSTSSLTDASDREKLASSEVGLLTFSALSESEIHRLVTRDLRNGSISYHESRPHSSRISKRKANIQDCVNEMSIIVHAWVYRERWWLLVLLLSSATGPASAYGIVMCFNAVLVPICTLGLGLFFAAPFAFFMATSHCSRVILFFYAFALVAVVPATTLGIYFLAIYLEYRSQS